MVDRKKLAADLATIQRIAQRPRLQSPLLALILAQAQALSEIEAWARGAEPKIASMSDSEAETEGRP